MELSIGIVLGVVIGILITIIFSAWLYRRSLPPETDFATLMYNHDKIIHEDYELQDIQNKLTIVVYKN